MSSARASISTALANLTQAEKNLTSAKLALEEAQTGAQKEDVAAAQAQLTQAQGDIAAARAAYAKTIIRAPFAGTLSAVNVSVGDVISLGSDVAIIVPLDIDDTERSWLLPLSAVKYTPSSAQVFTITGDGVLETHEVTTGLVTKDRISVTGLTGDETIVADVRGLKGGDTVLITQ